MEQCLPPPERVAQIITGAFRTIPGAAVNVEVRLFPVTQQLEQTALETAMRIRTIPLYAEITVSRKNSQSLASSTDSPVSSKASTAAPVDRLEKRQPHIVPPRWTPSVTRIAESLDAAI
ncbi:uncharacterized protein PV07_08790 [Cladophialophora immunda]|uniref:Uncharacterized protein n=1 Tax=Cladophialophora immunda TaxID=569365 RepID=A0A0D2CPW7_9EURO|nr:uncharacterized protein PV07_08790 [Cladophialophora immunda]KIW25624.1 hypothetical protein PV07_08790 [Cladophialophora immunda]OQV11016.1 hypothetical protein CLAIMM_14923 [Cladophialophora immunda]